MPLWGDFIGILGAWLKRPSITISREITGTGYHRMRDVITLIDAICDVYDNVAYAPLPNGTTFCNLSVAVVSTTMGCKDFFGKTADEIVAFISTDAEWSPVPFDRAQELANQGTLLIAGLNSKELGHEHGHVVIIRPGRPCYSGKWNATPRCLNIGAENFIARAKKGPLTNQPAGLNEAFVEMPKIWAWRPSL